MARKNENRVRSKTVSFYVTPLEHTEIQARIKVSGMPKGQYFIQSLLHQRIEISVGKYQSDRLSLELKKMREALKTIPDIEEIADIVIECNTLLKQLYEVTADNQILSAKDFMTKKMP